MNAGLPEPSTAPPDLRLTIERLACHVNLPEGVDDPLVARNRLTRLSQRDLAQACGDILSVLPGDDEAVYRIRHLHLDLWVDLQRMSDAEVTQRWGRLLAQAVMRAMQRGDARQVIRFPSPRQFVVAFLRDLLDGRAWSCWYYSEFRPLQSLTPAAIAIQLLAARPQWIAPVLAELATSGHTPRLIERWNLGDVTRLWTALGFAPQPTLAPPADQASTQVLDQVAATWKEAALSDAADETDRARDRLRLWLALVAERPAVAHDLQLAALVQALVALAALLRSEPALAPLLMMETELYPALVRRIAAGPLAAILDWLLPLSATAAGRTYLARLAAIAAERVGGRPSPAQTTEPEVDGTFPAAPEEAGREGRRILAPLSSPVGSVFLLAPALAELGLWERWRDRVGEERARGYLFVLALKALGRARSPLLLGDKMLAAFAGLDEPPTADVRRPTQADSAAPDWANELPALAARWYPLSPPDLLVGTTAQVHVLRNVAAACWLAAAPVAEEEGEWRPAAQWPDLDVDLAAVRREPTATEADTLGAEAAHLQLGDRLGYPWLTPSLDAALSVAASLALRRTAARLPKFAQASPAYLAGQFLAQPATLRADSEALTVGLSGGPLLVVLRLADLPESIHVPWLSLPLRLELAGVFAGPG